MKNKLLTKIIAASFLLTGFNVANAQWTQLNSGTIENLNEIFFPVAGTGYVVGENGTVLKTTNGGINWNHLSTGLTLDFHELYFLTSNEGWIVGDSGSICHTADGGISWNCFFLESAADINLHSVYALNSNVLFVGGDSNKDNGYIAKTVNSGVTWQQAYMEHYIWDVDIKKIGMVNDSVGYAITRGYVLKTTDYGMNWHITDTASVHAEAMFHVLEDLAFFPDNDTLYVCGWYGGYFGKTVNGGNTWQHNNNYQPFNLDFINTQTGYIGGSMHKTTDGGMSFTDASGGSDSLLYDIYSIDFTDEWTGYACGAGGKIIKTINGGATGVHSSMVQFHSEFALYQNYPNPFNPSTVISFTLPESNIVTLKVFNILGEEIAVLIKEKLPVGNHQVEWHPQDISSGIYFYRMEAGSFVQTRKLVLIR